MEGEPMKMETGLGPPSKGADMGGKQTEVG